ncbi:MAG: orotate phosphoribosyltransferase [Verrucomicrobia bacterium]|nr:MAG: orotate phosphoribosyltransferase [Verrucomicrobiota bacterium]
MNEKQNEILQIFIDSGALLTGHFILRSGLHSEHFFQCAKVGEDMGKITRLATLLIEKLGKINCDTVLAPAMGGLVIGQEVARQLGKRYLFAEKVDNLLVLRRDFKIKPGEKVLVVEDVITRGGRAQEAIDIVKKAGGNVVALAVLVDRSNGNAKFDVPFTSLLEMSFPTYDPNNLPAHLQGHVATKPGS